jgi:charged multivesicular body protein 7
MYRLPSNFQIMKSYESSTVTLRAILSHPALQRDKIDETMSAMAEAGADAREVDEAIRIGGEATVGVDVDEGELEEELGMLVKEAEMEGEREREMKREAEVREKLEGVSISGVAVDVVEGPAKEPVTAT